MLARKCDGKSLENIKPGRDMAQLVVLRVYSPLTEEETDSDMASDLLRITMQMCGSTSPEPESGPAQPRVLSLAVWLLPSGGKRWLFHFSA